MQLDENTRALLAKFGNNLDAPVGESLEDIQQTRRTALTEQIADLKKQIDELKESARQAAREHEQYLRDTRRGILNDESLTDGKKQYLLRDFQNMPTTHEVLIRELACVYPLQRQLSELERRLIDES